MKSHTTISNGHAKLFFVIMYSYLVIQSSDLLEFLLSILSATVPLLLLVAFGLGFGFDPIRNDAQKTCSDESGRDKGSIITLILLQINIQNCSIPKLLLARCKLRVFSLAVSEVLSPEQPLQ